jgi:hypothetical protein
MKDIQEMACDSASTSSSGSSPAAGKRLLSVPYEDQLAFARYADPPRPEQIVHQTFCGT